MTRISTNIGKLARPLAPSVAQLDIEQAIADDELTLAAIIKQERFSNTKKKAHTDLEAHAVYIAGTAGAVPRRFGDNLGAWPVRTGKTRHWIDNITPPMESVQPLWWMGVLFRLWTPSDAHAANLLMAMGEHMRTRAPDDLRGAWRSLEQPEGGIGQNVPGLDAKPERLPPLIVKFRTELMAVAKRANIAVWTDLGHSRHLDTLVEAKKSSIEAALGDYTATGKGRH
jgi:hypothetical protein